jgi:hypothetical protein
MVVLNSQQQKAFSKIMSFLASDRNFFLLEGDPGTGKTTLISKLFDSTSIYSNYNIAFSATTNKAVSILEQTCTLKKKNVIFTTIQKLLNIKRNIDENGKEIYLQSGFTMNEMYDIRRYDIVLIDESSMICEHILRTITSVVNSMSRKNLKIIFIGDRNQLPPVNESLSSVFFINFGEHVSKLDKIERFRNDIVKYAMSIKHNTKIKKSLLDIKDVQFTKDYSNWVDDYMTDIDSSIILAYTNSKKRSINRDVRSKLFPGVSEKYNINERIIFNNYYSTKENIFYSSQQAKITMIETISYRFNPLPVNKLLNLKVTLKDNLKTVSSLNKSCPICLDEDKETMAQTRCDHLFCEKCIKLWLKDNRCCPLCRFIIEGDTVTVKDSPMISLLINKMIKLVSDVEIDILKIKICSKINRNNKMVSIGDDLYVVPDSSKKQYSEICDTIKKILVEIKENISKKNRYNNIILRRLWEFFYNNYVDVIADIDYGYCITVHKSQGSTFRRVFVDIMDIIKNNKSDTKNCVYTAVTRASEFLNIKK